MAVHLVCEGDPKGLDDRVLDTVVIRFHRLAVLIEPSGGSKGHGAVRTYLEGRSSHDVAITVEDRDYRPQTIATATWAKQAGNSFMWRRHEIENYLLHPRIVLELFNDFRRTTGAAWVNSLPGSEADISALLQTLATPLLEDHAAEVLKDELVRRINGIGSLSFGPPRPTPSAGAHTCGQAQWIPALLLEASRLCQTCNQVAVLQDLQSAAITPRYNTVLARFQNPAFLTSGEYLIDMAGKKILASLSHYLHGLHAPGALDNNFLADELLRMLERIYQPKLIYQPDDFDELAAILRQY